MVNGSKKKRKPEGACDALGIILLGKICLSVLMSF